MGQELFLKNKISRQIKQNGSEYTFNHYGVDEYGQLSDEVQATHLVHGIFHETINQVRKGLSEAEAAKIAVVPSSAILCLFEEGVEIDLDDVVEINKNKYKVVNKVNVGNYNVAFDISIRMEEDGDYK